MRETQSVCLKKHPVFVLISSIDEESVIYIYIYIYIYILQIEVLNSNELKHGKPPSKYPMAFSTERIVWTGFDNIHFLRYSARYIYDKQFRFFEQLVKLDCSLFIIGDFGRTRGDQVTRKRFLYCR
jgi:hypothetical protein